MILLKEYMSGPWSNPWSESRPRSWFWYRTGSRSESRSLVICLSPGLGLSRGVGAVEDDY